MNPKVPSGEKGTMSVVTATSQAVFEVRDWGLRSIAQGLTPWTSDLKPGFYSVTVRYPGQPAIRRVVALKPGESTIVSFDAERGEERNLSGILTKMAPMLPTPVTLSFSTASQGTESARTVAPSSQQKATERSHNIPPLLGVRFFQLKPPGIATPAQRAYAEIDPSDDSTTLIVHPSDEAPLFLQIGESGAPVLNVAIPSRRLYTDRVRVGLAWSEGRLKASVEFERDWTSTAVEFARTGHLREAREAVQARTDKFEDFNVVGRQLAIRFGDTAGIAYLPYLMLRYADPQNAPKLYKELPQRLIQTFDFLPDTRIVAAELEARAGDHASAVANLLALPEGALPLFTDGFRILVSRLRVYGNPDPKTRPEGITDDQAAQAQAHEMALSRWASYIDQSALTLTFPGMNPAEPSTQALEGQMTSTGWTPLSPGTADDETMIGFEKEQIAERRKYYREHYDNESDPPTFGVALSGGGIRSGTLNLGILQGLTARGLLEKVDYLSTVSGGGYIGSWLHGVIRNCGGGSIDEKVRELLCRPECQPHDEAGKDPIEFLRKYSSYLAPDVGLFSADFWTILVIWFRNMLLNQMMIIPLLALITAMTMNIGIWRAWFAQNGGSTSTALSLAALALFLASLLAGKGAGRVARWSPAIARSWIDSNFNATFCTGLVVCASFLIACSSSTIDAAPNIFIRFLPVPWIVFFVLQWEGGFVSCYRQQHPRRSPFLAGVLLVLFSLISGIAAAALFFCAVHWIAAWDAAAAGNWHVVAWGAPLLIVVWLTAAAIHIGLMGGDYPDHAREWLARVGALMSIAGLAWALFFVLSVFGPWWLSLFALAYGKSAVSAIGAWFVTSAAGVMAAKSDRSSGNASNKKNSAALEWLVKLAPTVFLAGFLLLISFGIYTGIRTIWGVHCDGACTPVAQTAANSGKFSFQVSSGNAGDRSIQMAYQRETATPSWLNWLKPLVNDYWCVLATGPNPLDKTKRCRMQPEAWRWALILLALPFLIVLPLGTRIDINGFSMHHFYKNRLVRCYLGAARAEARHPSRFTGFDPSDDFPLSALLAKPYTVATTPGDSSPYYGPYPILNGAVNLFRGSDLARQERKAESFIFTPLYCGFTPPHSAEDEGAIGPRLSRNGYRPTFNYGYVAKGYDIGTCTAISGAAANPNWGYHTSAPVAFLLTIFDVRLGWWVGNPRRTEESRRPGPRFSPYPLLSELFAQTDPRAAYLNISDGGHFENLGIYELVRRRCRFIIAGDGEQDNDLTFESLGGAIRKCRADFGVEIDIDPRRIKKSVADEFSKVHCVVGHIRYPGETRPSLLLYLKASLTNDEPEDVAQYQAVHNDFPHEPTPNQFFTESQFESYRKLGLHVFETAFEGIDVNQPIDKMFECLRKKWYPPTDVAEGVGTRHSQVYSSLMQRLADDPELSYLDQQIFPFGAAKGSAQPEDNRTEQIERRARFFCLGLIQLMENVWADLHLGNPDDYSNPLNQGWIELFKLWVRQDIFTTTWETASGTFNPGFVDFFERLKNT
jgi:hypothetical protein